ncbi:MAG: murein biosynthesis integral membrane protein MurJ [Anaerolineae bacterium]|nr:murein biosynthesis integral membrane protein MurJ [Anaerolineae bacterium]
MPASASSEVESQEAHLARREAHLARNTLVVAAFFGLAAGAALVRNMVIARQFGISGELDIYYAAFKLPELLFTIVAGGALATALIPVLSGYLARDDRAAFWRLASAISNVVGLAIAVLALVAGILAPMLVRRLIAPGFTPEAQAETARVMRVVLVSTLIFGLSAVQTSVLHSVKHFLLPALAPTVYPLGVVAGALFLAPRWGIRGLAVGAVAGACLHLAVQVPGLMRYGFSWQPILSTRDGAVPRVLKLMAPRILDLGVFQLTLLLTANLASRLGAGSLSALEWGWDLMQLPETVIGTAFGLVALPTLAELAAQQELAALRQTMSDTLRAILGLTIPAAMGLILLGRPLLEVLYQRGAFGSGATEAVYIAVRFYALGLVGHACLEVVARAFFAQQDTVTPLFIAVGSAAANLLLGVALMGPLGHGGLALANTLAVSVEVLVLLAVLRRRWGGIEGRETLKGLAQIGLATTAMGAVVGGILWLGQRVGLGPLWLVALGAGAGGFIYLVVGWQLRLTAVLWPLRALGWQRS